MKISNRLLTIGTKVLVFSTMPISVIFLFFIYVNFSNTLTHLSQAVINKTINKTKFQVNMLLAPVKKNIEISRDRLKYLDISELNVHDLNSFFIPFYLYL